MSWFREFPLYPLLLITLTTVQPLTHVPVIRLVQVVYQSLARASQRRPQRQCRRAELFRLHPVFCGRSCS
jgi:hypothetical protein